MVYYDGDLVFDLECDTQSGIKVREENLSQGFRFAQILDLGSGSVRQELELSKFGITVQQDIEPVLRHWEIKLLDKFLKVVNEDWIGLSDIFPAFTA